MATKLYCYVDETGQDTRGRFFIVGIAIVNGAERERLRQMCLALEQQSGKGERKWTKTSHERRQKFFEHLLKQSDMQVRMYYAIYHDTTNYVTATLRTIKLSFAESKAEEFQATVIIDGLPRTMERAIGLQLRQAGVPAKKVRGARDENDPIIRLVDSICGIVRETVEARGDWGLLLELAIEKGLLQELE